MALRLQMNVYTPNELLVDLSSMARMKRIVKRFEKRSVPLPSMLKFVNTATKCSRPMSSLVERMFNVMASKGGVHTITYSCVEQTTTFRMTEVPSIKKTKRNECGRECRTNLEMIIKGISCYNQLHALNLDLRRGHSLSSMKVFLSKNKQLKRLSINYFIEKDDKRRGQQLPLGIVGFKRFTEALKDSKEIQEFSLSCDRPGAFPAEYLDMVLEAVSNNQNIKEVDLEFFAIKTRKNLQSLFKALYDESYAVQQKRCDDEDSKGRVLHCPGMIDTGKEGPKEHIVETCILEALGLARDTGKVGFNLIASPYSVLYDDCPKLFEYLERDDEETSSSSSGSYSGRYSGDNFKV